MTNDCKTCPVSTGAHKPAEAVHQIDEPALEALRERMQFTHARLGHAERFVEAPAAVVAEVIKLADRQHARIAELESQLEAIGAGGVEPLRKRAAAPQGVQAAVPKWIDDPHDIEQGQMLNPEWVKLQQSDATAHPAEGVPAPVEVGEREALRDGAWYWVERETWGNETSIAPAMYKANCDAWYSYQFGGIPTRHLKVLAPCLMQARAALAATHPTQQGLDAQALKQSFREFLSVSEHIDAGGHAMDSIATDLTRIVLTEEEVSAVIARRNHCNASGQAGEDAANIRAAALAAQAKQGGE